ncbi:MAG: hypothetical protein DMG58_09245 [Acidobacteria bacterium]|nr:MAG: hypothetical protein DMG58_09245 [Acidobacteriota bacterium]
MRRAIRGICLTILAISSVAAENWPQWRGPGLNGISNEKDLPVRWSRDENVAWKLPLPSWSGATPIIWGDRIFLNVAEKEDLSLWCVDRVKGAVLWKKHLAGGNFKIGKQNMSSPSPVTDGTNVYAMTGNGIVKGFDLAGNELWARDIQKDYGQFGLNWGYGSSPLLFEDALYIQVLHGMKTRDPSYLLRIDKKTGKTVWRVERATEAVHESPDSYTTPVVLRYGGKVEIVVSGGDCVTGHDAARQWVQRAERSQLQGHRLAGGERWRGLYPHPRPPLAGVSRRRPRGHHPDALALGVSKWPRCSDTGDRRDIFLHRQRPRCRVVPGCQNGQGNLGTPAHPQGHLQRIASAGRWQNLHHG